MASSVFAERATSGVPRHTGAASTATTAISRLNTGSANGSTSRAVANDAVTATPATSASPRSTGRPACSNRRTSSHNAAALATTTSVLNIHPGALITIRRNTGNSTTALIRRFSSPDLRGVSSVTLVGIATSDSTEAPVAALVVGDGAVEVGGLEVGPERRRHPELGVGDLPQEEVGDTHLAAGADEQIGVGDAVRVQRAAHVGLGHGLRRQLAGLHATRERAKGVGQLVAPTLVERHRQGEPGVVWCLQRHVLESAAHGQRHAGRAADHAQPDLVLHQLRQLAIDRLLEQPHQHGDLVLGPAPVLRRERIEREEPQAHRVRRANDGARRLDALAVARHPGQAALGGPAPVAIHDDGDVRGHRLRAHGFQQRGLGGHGHQKDMISCSFFFRSSSILAMKRSVVFWIWSWPRRSSSSVIGVFLSFASALSLSLASRRTLRTATRASSAILWTFLTSCLRRSSVGVGMLRRMTLPSFTGWMPRSDFMIAFSISFSCAASHGWIISVRASGTDTEAIWLMGVELP